MRININNPEHIKMVSELCDSKGCSPTQLIIELINNTHQQHAQGCNQDAEKETDSKVKVH